jgi:hypothetical protein
MTTIIVDDEDVQWTWTPRDPNFVPPTIRQLLAEEFSPEADFYVCDGQPYVVYPMWDYATDWSGYPIREIHPFYPVLHGKKITEAEFRSLVRATQAIGD